MLREKVLFLGEFLRCPTVVGAVAPSSASLAAAITFGVPERGDPVVVELGPGTGAFTAEIQRKLGGRGRHLAVEVNPAMARALAARCDNVELIEGDAAALRNLLSDRGVKAVDVVVSGLPWAVFTADHQRAVLNAVTAVLRPDGALATFAYLHARALPSAVRFRRRLATAFQEVVTGRPVWRNLPPALVLQARCPRRTGLG